MRKALYDLVWSTPMIKVAGGLFFNTLFEIDDHNEGVKCPISCDRNLT
jgi:hypothetical protein